MKRFVWLTLLALFCGCHMSSGEMATKVSQTYGLHAVVCREASVGAFWCRDDATQRTFFCEAAQNTFEGCVEMTGSVISPKSTILEAVSQ